MLRAVRYVEITVDVAAEAAPPLVEALVTEGLAIEERDASTLLKPAPGRALIIAWSEVAAAEETRAHVEEVLRRLALVAEVGIAEHDEDEWRDVWKKFFKPRSVGAFAIVPSWHAEYVARPDETIIRLDPGRAFGTGGHASTRLCLEALSTFEPVERVLDVGCGSGILGIACALRWPSCQVIAVDVDPEAAATTIENAEDNGVADRIAASTTDLARVAKPPGLFDLVLANIQADVLIKLSALLIARAGRHLVLSGILDEQADGVSAAFAERGAREVSRVSDEGWTALVLDPTPATGGAR